MNEMNEMHESFEKAFERTVGLEGGLSDHPSDSGGRTNYGITEGTLIAWRMIRRLDEPVAVDDLTPVAAKLIYLELFWEPLRLNELTDNIAAELFDSAVNCGPASAVKMAQNAANFIDPDGARLTVDGSLGPLTRGKLNELSLRYELPLLRAMNGEQYMYYRELVNRRPKDRAFSRGWTKRLA